MPQGNGTWITDLRIRGSRLLAFLIIEREAISKVEITGTDSETKSQVVDAYVVKDTFVHDVAVESKERYMLCVGTLTLSHEDSQPLKSKGQKQIIGMSSSFMPANPLIFVSTSLQPGAKGSWEVRLIQAFTSLVSSYQYSSRVPNLHDVREITISRDNILVSYDKEVRHILLPRFNAL